MLKFKFLRVVSVFLLVSALFISCSKAEFVKVSAFSLSELEECVEIAKYKGMTFEFDGTDEQDMIKNHLKAESKLKKLPEGAVDYYLDQLEKEYKYYAEQAGVKYEELLEQLALTQKELEDEAKSLVFEDIIFAIIQKKENITVTDSDKEKYFDRYVTRYAEIHKYSEEHVRANLKEEVYQTMLYDKTMEYLIINNTFN